jgi:peptidoglycan/xylan/chitin deacetylase (PgdA/CDA1 family)
LKIAIQAERGEAELISSLLYPWSVSLDNPDKAEVTITYKKELPETKKTVVIPSDSSEFRDCAKKAKCSVTTRPGARIQTSRAASATLTMTPSVIYQYEQQAKPDSSNVLVTIPKESTAFLAVDVVHEYELILKRILNVRPSTTYRLLTSSPIPYTLAPTKLRNALTRDRQKAPQNLGCRDMLPLDAARLILAEALEAVSGKRLLQRTWNQKKYACILTHDVETQNGLQRTKQLKKLEERYDFPSAWYIPSEHYKLDPEMIKQLVSHGEIGAHDTKHDGKLVYLPKKKLVKRLIDARKTLSRLAGHPISGFRAPLLQHNATILRAVQDSGYEYDTSIPTWEPRHPCTMKPHGIGTSFPLVFDELTELPVTLPQDHQLISVLGLTPRQATAKWAEMRHLISGLGGLCTFLVHPDYQLANQESVVYEEVLSSLASDNEVWVTLPTEVVQVVRENRVNLGGAS